ncbi:MULTISPECIES: phage tail assembly protein [unclassified Sphingomonas]|uniref:phage tail assembly protein n=1 Tax=unclassified Sphingomonas TaxID=196159 RepID=UPI000834DEF2|nr:MULTISPECIES: phage tail assembly protein [unclassified Sphingomonas]
MSVVVEKPYQLKHALTVTFKPLGGPEREEVITEVTLRRATGKDLRLIDRLAGQPMALVLEAIATLSGLELAIVERLDAEDIGPLGELAMSRLEGGRPTGGTP